AAVAMGAFTTAATAMGATPFANSVAAGTEGCAPAVAALDASADAAHLLALVVAGARPDAVAMAERARAGHVVAAALAEHKAAVSGVSFREAHHDIGAAITASDLGLVAAADPADVVAAARFGAGPGSSPPLERSRSRWAGWVSEHRARARHWQHAAQRLDAAVDTVCSGRQSSAEASLTAPAPV
ncbi:MAG: hypothetical protein ACRDY7_01730, partial [Acidimicrobiia bacterium]